MLQKSVHTKTKSFRSVPFRSILRLTFQSRPLFGTERNFSRRSRVNTCKNSFVFWNSSISFRSVPFRSRVNGAQDCIHTIPANFEKGGKCDRSASYSHPQIKELLSLLSFCLMLATYIAKFKNANSSQQGRKRHTSRCYT